MNRLQDLKAGKEVSTMRHKICTEIADMAVAALVEEVELTPKPGLVDRQNNGSHTDLNIFLMRESALSLRETFFRMAELTYGKKPTVPLREQFGAIGRIGEQHMFSVTNDVNTHKGAIWSIGLLCAAIARRKGDISFPTILDDAAELAKLPDRMIPAEVTNGLAVKQKYGLHGAREEAQYGFPHIRKYAYPAYQKALLEHKPVEAKLMALLALVSNLNDTCLVHRGGLEALEFAKSEAGKVMQDFSLGAVERMDRQFQQAWISPGGSADLLAATFFISNWISRKQRRLLNGEISLQISGK